MEYIVLVGDHKKCYGLFKNKEKAEEFASGFKDAWAIPLWEPPGQRSPEVRTMLREYT